MPVYTQPIYNTSPAWTQPVLNGGIPVQGESGIPTGPTPAAPIDGGSTPPPGPEAERTNVLPEAGDSNDTAMLNLQIPANAVVYVNGSRTSTPGNFRSYVSRNLKPGRNYTYEVKAELERDGQVLTRTRVVQLTVGDNKTFDMNFDQNSDPITSVTLLVPEDARVSLGGVDTNASGPMRYFSTSKLKDGESWSAYRVVVTVERDGKQLKRERVIDVNAGDSVNLRFDFDSDGQVASR